MANPYFFNDNPVVYDYTVEVDHNGGVAKVDHNDYVIEIDHTFYASAKKAGT